MPRGRRRKMSERERKLREMAMEIVESLEFEEAIVLLYEEAMRAERKEYTKRNPEDPANGHYERKVKVPRTRRQAPAREMEEG